MCMCDFCEPMRGSGGGKESREVGSEMKVRRIMMTLSLLIHLIRKEILWMSDGIDQGGTVQWELLLCNLACFAIVFGVLYKGIQSLGKVRTLQATLLTAYSVAKKVSRGTQERITDFLHFPFLTSVYLSVSMSVCSCF